MIKTRFNAVPLIDKNLFTLFSPKIPFGIPVILMATLFFCGLLVPNANAQSNDESLPVNESTKLPTSGTEDLQKSTAALQSSLTELQQLSLQTKQAHWNVSGTLFYPLHEMLQEHYEGISNYADMVSERMLSIGSSSDGRAPTVVQTSKLPEIPAGFIDDAQVLTFFIKQYQTVGQRLYNRIDEIEKIDPTSANLLQEVEAAIEKYQWQVRAEFQQTSTDSNDGSDLNGGQPVELPMK
jgi:starvation-inducible DNA-binding protein